MKESCALCKSQARIYCESDKAMLCWTCDAKVHSANFLVAKHCRCLLCHVCQSPTPWSASGEKLGRTISVCERCINDCHRVNEEDGQLESEEDYDDDEDETDDDDVDLDVEEDEEEDEEEEENQVVPWSSVSPPPSPSSSSTRDYRSNLSDDLCSKRMPDTFPDLSSDDDFECMSSQAAAEDDDDGACGNGSTEADVELSSSIRALKVGKMEAEQVFNVGHRLVESLKRLHEEDINPGSTRMCRSRY